MKKLTVVLCLLCVLLCAAIFFGCQKPDDTPADPCAEGHTFENWQTSVKATCGAAGKKVASCTVCGAAGEESIPPTGNHRLSNDVTTLGMGIDTPGEYTALCSTCGINLDGESVALSELLSASASAATTALDLTGYSIVYDDTNTSKLYLSTVYQLQTSLNAVTGLAIPVVPQSQRANDRTQPEILIGDTNRDASYIARDTVVGNGFIIKIAGNKLVIIGNNELQTICAMQYLIYQFLPTHQGGATLAMPTIEAKSQDTLLLMNGTSSDFEIIYSKDVSDDIRHQYVSSSTSDSRDYPCVAAHSISSSLTSIAGMGTNSFTVKSNEVMGASVILVGDMDDIYMKGVLNSLDGDEYAIVVNEGKILLAAWNDYALQACISEFTKLVHMGKDAEEKSWSFPSLFFAKGSANEKWVTDFPRPTGEGIALVTTRSANNNALQFVYEGEGVTPAAFAAYCQTLLSEGFRIYTQNEIEGSEFITFVNEQTNVYLYVAYNAYTYKNDPRNLDPNTHILTQNMNSDRDGKWTSEHPLRDYQACIRVISAPLDGSYKIPEELLTQQSYKQVTDGSISTVFLNGNAVGHCYIISLEDGSFIVVDGGNNYNDAPLRLYNTLAGLYKNIYGTEPTAASPIRIAAWYVTHSHGDHYGAFRQFLITYGKNGSNVVRVNYLIGNFPDRTAVYSVGSDSTQMGTDSYVAAMQESVTGGFEIIKLYTGQKLYLANVELEALMTFNDHAPYIIDNSNDTNTVIRMTIRHKVSPKTTTWLFPGDSCVYQSRYLCAMYGDYLKSDIMQMAHHGNIGCEIALYDIVSPTVLFFSHHLSQYFTYTRESNKNKGWPYNVDYHVAHELASVKYIYTGGYTNYVAVTVNFKSDGTLDYSNVYNVTTGNKIAYSANSKISCPATPAIKNF